ncbi:hypothetical protein VTK26DRAFT_3269 [Humicola hyalothermophila]
MLRSRQLWRWIRVAVIFGVVWLLLQTARESDALSWSSDSYDDDQQTNICRAHGWKRFRAKDPSTPRKVYDLMMVNTELDWLEIRLNSTFDEVDYYVLVEGRKTFTNRDKPLTLRDNLHRFAAYRSKIIYHEIEYPPGFRPRTTWDMEDLQRNAMLTQVFPRLRGAQAPQLGDVIVVSDVDEIPRPETLALLRACAFPRRLTLRSRFYYYSFQWLHRGAEWAHPQATYYQGPRRTLRPNDLRIADGGLWPFREWEKADLWNASWHCSSCFRTMDELLTKMASFAHTSMNAERFRDRKRIADRVRRGKDLWDRPGEVYDRIEGNTDVPKFLLENSERFAYMLNRDGPSAGFEDYEE